MIRNFNLDIDRLLLFIEVTFPFVDKRELGRLYDKAGYPRLSVTKENTVNLLSKDNEFAVGYGKLVRLAVDSREFKQALKLGQFDWVQDRFDGETEDVTTTAVGSNDSGGGGNKTLDWITGIAGALGKLGDMFSKVGDTIKGTNSQKSEAELRMAEAALAAAQSRKNTMLIVGVGGVVVILVLVVVLLKR